MGVTIKASACNIAFIPKSFKIFFRGMGADVGGGWGGGAQGNFTL